MNHLTPRISIAMPMYNAAATLPAAMNSILAQTVDDWELLLIDDGSTDSSVAIANSYSDPRVDVLVDGMHKGLPTRLNEATLRSRGKYYARMDADDICYPHRFQKQLEFMEANPSVDLVGSWILVFGCHGTVIGKRTSPPKIQGNHGVWRSVPVAHPTFFGKREWFRKNPYHAWPLNFQDQNLLIRTQTSSNISVLPEILLGYREEQLTIKKQLRYRLSFFKAAKPLTQELGAASTFALLGVQAAKLGVDWFAVTTGLTYKVLRNRASGTTEAENAEWVQIWAETNKAAFERL